MIISNLQIKPLNIAFRVNFKHNSAERNKTQSVLVATQTSNGNIGLGEGCPREYVTGENIDSCIKFFNTHKHNILLQIHSFKDLKNWVLEHQQLIDINPSAWCAIELSLLDALSKENKQSIEKTLGLSELEDSFQYSAVLGDSTIEVTKSQIDQYCNFGFNDFKVKITGNPIIDNKKFELIKASIPNARIRLDANNLWQNSKDVLRYLESISISPFAIEEPLSAMDFRELNKLLKITTIPIILDESFYNKLHFKQITMEYRNVIINLRISKMGGIIRSDFIAKKATQSQIPLIIGAQVGESSILTRAALLIANAYKDNLLAQEGAYGTLLLESDITDKPLMFGKFGKLNIVKFLDVKEYGFQINYKNNYVQHWL